MLGAKTGTWWIDTGSLLHVMIVNSAGSHNSVWMSCYQQWEHYTLYQTESHGSHSQLDVKGSSAVYFSISYLEIKMYGNNIHKKTKRKMVLFPMNMLLIDSCKNLQQSTLCTDKDDLNTSDFSGNVIKKSWMESQIWGLLPIKAGARWSRPLQQTLMQHEMNSKQ